MNKHNEYYLGLDIGTNSVGWAVTSTNYNLQRFNNKWMHGVRMFDAMSTAEARRLHRGSRRRLNRRKDRLNQLKAYFEREINQIDPTFFTRLEEGFLQEEDRSVERTFTLFNDDNFTDKDFYKKFKTIYDLRLHLMESTEKEDVRLIYLAAHHIMKYRGHFLFHGQLNLDGNIKELIQSLNALSLSIFDKEVYSFKNEKELKSFLEILTDTSLNKMDRTKAIKIFVNPEISKDEKHFEEIHKMLCARKSSLQKLFINDELLEDVTIEFEAPTIEETLSNLNMIGEEGERLVRTIKAIYDWALLQNILKEENSISKAMVLSYQQHKEDLLELKKIVKEIGPKEYKEFFHDETKKGTYAFYVENGNQSLDDLYRMIAKILKNAPKKYDKVIYEIDLKMKNRMYLLKQRIPTNGIIPHQLHLYELETILNNAAKHYDILNYVDETNLSVSQQIKELFKFRIPYYIGPLNDAHKEEGFAWVCRKERGKVYPWNFEDKIDVEKTAEAFIREMTNKCSYILDEDVLPKSSLLYEKFMVLNEINNIKINGENISVERKQKLFDDLFIFRKTNVSKKTIENWVKNNFPEYLDKSVDITGVDDIIKSKLNSYHSFKSIFGDNMPDQEVLENIVFWITIFPDERQMLESRINKEYPDMFSKEELSKISKLVFSGWGRLSQKMLEGLLDNDTTNEPRSIIQALQETNHNLMELLSSQFPYQSQINKLNETSLKNNDSVTYERLDKLNLPPNVKRPIWQTIRITQELVKVQGRQPKRIFIEMAREIGEKGKRTTSRKNQLINFYKSLDYEPEFLESLMSQLNKETDDSLRKRKLYLYYKQLGRCMYSGERIYISELDNNSKYDIDHIYPRSVTADDSLRNLVLVKKEYNNIKSDNYPIKPEWQSSMAGFWYQLHKNELIEKETYFRLTRKTPLTVEELSGFVARQLVETRQATKAVINIMKQIYPESEVVTIKAQHIDRFRHQNEIIKVRSLNDLHHAKDAYLSIVVGNVYHERFTSDPRNYIQKAQKRDYNLITVLNTKDKGKDIYSKKDGQLVWKSGPEGTIKKVKNTLKNNAILTTYMIQNRTGELFDQNPVSKAKNRVPLKTGLDTEKYGGYHKASYAYYAVIDRDMGKKRVRNLVPVHMYVKESIKTDEDLIQYFESKQGYKNVDIILSNIPAVNILLEFDKSFHRITGVAGSQFLLRNETQPYFNDEFVNIWKIIENVKTNNRLDLVNKITKKNLIYVINEIQNKMESEFYKQRLENFIELMENRKESLIDLNNVDLIDLSWELIKLIKSTRESSNLKLIGGSVGSGTNYLGQNISNKKEIFLVNQSVTGLYENKIDLLKL